MTSEFFALVKELREAQKKYFKSRMSYDFERAKKLEKEVDKIICDLEEKKESKPKDLFS